MKSRWLINPRPNEQAKLRLFCFPYAAGNASTYTGWWRWLPAEVELLAVQPPGRANRIEEPAYRSMESMVEALSPVLEPWLDKPYVIFGHSLGSRVGFEFMHRALRERWPLPRLFIASGSSAPHVPRDHKKISHLGDAEFLRALGRFNGPTDRLLQDERLVKLFMPTLRADFNIADSYARQCGVQLDCRAVIFGGNRDEDARSDELDSWQAHFSQPIAIDVFEGDHFFVEGGARQVVGRIAELLIELLGDAGAAGGCASAG